MRPVDLAEFALADFFENGEMCPVSGLRVRVRRRVEAVFGVLVGGPDGGDIQQGVQHRPIAIVRCLFPFFLGIDRGALSDALRQRQQRIVDLVVIVGHRTSPAPGGSVRD